VSDIDATLALSEADLPYWVEEVTSAYASGMDIDHAVAMVKERDMARHPDFYENRMVQEKFEDLSSLRAQVDGVWRWLEQTRPRSDS